MKYNPDIHHRRSIRLRKFDYSANGAYFVTICAQERECLFGRISNGIMKMNDAGRMVKEWWIKLPDKFPGISLDEFMIMPNHFHGIVVINDAGPVGADPCVCPDVTDSVGAPPCGCPPLDVTSKTGQPHGDCPYDQTAQSGRQNKRTTLGDVMDWFKSMTTNAYICGVKKSGWTQFPGRLWQRNYYERIIRDDSELAAVREYIVQNPVKWTEDKENPDFT